MKRHVGRALGLFWSGLAALLIAFALFVQIGRLALPHLSDWQHDVEYFFSRQLGVSVSFEKITASWDGLSPEIVIKDLKLVDSDKQQLLSVQSAITRLDLLQSFLHLSWYFERVQITGVKAVLNQWSDGRWALAGFSPGVYRDQRKARFDPFAALLTLNNVRLNDIELRFLFRSGRQYDLSLSTLGLDNDRDFHRFEAALQVEGNEEPLRLVYEGVGEPGSGNFSGQGYLQLNNYPLEDVVAFASESLADSAGIRDGFLSASLWFTNSAEQQFNLQGSARFDRTGEITDKVPAEIISDITASWHPHKGWQLRLQQIHAFWEKHEMQPLDLMVSGGFQRKNYTISLSQLELQPWIEFTRNLDVLPEVADRILGELNVAGTVNNLQMQVTSDSPQDFFLRANLSDVSVNEWKGSPQIGGLDGYIEATALSGLVQIDSSKNFLMHYPKVYKHPFVFESASGEVAWHIDIAANQVLVNSGLLAMRGDLGRANGYFYLDAPLERGSRVSELVLQIGLQEGSVADHQYLVPYVIPDSLGNWLDSALIDGDVSSGGFTMHSYFGRQPDEPALPSAIQVALNIEGATLAYDQRWPVLEKLSGFVQLDIPTVDAWIDDAEILQARVSSGAVHIGENPHGKGQLLHIKSDVKASASSGLRVFTETPLKEALGGVFENWTLVGELTGGLELDIPLSAGEPGQYQKVEAELSDADLTLQNLNLNLSDLDAVLNFETGLGLNAKNISASLWQQPVVVNIASSRNVSGREGWQTEIDFKSQVDFNSIAQWSKRPELMFIEGVVPVAAQLTLGSEGALFQAESQLQGAAIDLPAPFGKKRSEKRRLSVAVPLEEGGYGLRFNYSDLVYGDLRLRTDAPAQGTISLAERKSVDGEGIWLSGVVAELNGRDWWPLLGRYQTYSDRLTDAVVAERRDSENLFNLDLDIKLFNWDEWQLDEFRLTGGVVSDGWLLHLNDDRVAGDLRLFNEPKPPEIDLDYIRWPKPAPIVEPSVSDVSTELLSAEVAKAETEDPLSDFDPHNLTSLKFSIDELLLGGEDYGRWSFLFESTPAGLAVRNIEGSIRHVTLTGPQGAELYWDKSDQKQELTRFLGVIEGKNLADVTDAWSFPRLMESETLSIDADFSWHGSPAMFAVNKLQGDLLLSVRNGRFYQSTGQTSDAFLRLVGLFNFDSWARRLKFDFSDVYKVGMPFEKIDGAMRFERGMIYLQEPLSVQNTSSSMKMGGKIDLVEESLDASLVATLPVGGNATFFTALAAGLPAAAGVYLVSKVFRKQMEQVASVSYKMKGPWVDPKITFDKLFDSKAAEKAGEKSRKEGLERNREALTPLAE